MYLNLSKKFDMLSSSLKFLYKTFFITKQNLILTIKKLKFVIAT